jgi:hypothetical protein
MFVVAGCRPYHMYEGEFRSDEDVGTVTQTYAIRMMTIDGGDTGLSQTFKLLPGRHRLEAQVHFVGTDPEIDPRLTRTAHHRQGQVRRYMCTCQLELEVTPASSWLIDGGKIADHQWAMWAVEPKPSRPDHTWAEVEKLDPPRCTCEGKE